jgi:malonate transporter and related proteins
MSADIFSALAPVVLLIALGALLNRRRFLGDGFWPAAERLCYFILLPCLFVHSLAAARLEAVPVGALALTLILPTLAVAALLVALRPLTRLSGPAFTSVFQGGVRFNNYVGVTLAAGLFGAKGLALAAVCNAALVPTVNILCVLVFSRHGTTTLDLRGVLKQVAVNPLVVASFAGIAFQATGLNLPVGIEPTMKALGAAALPLGLLCVGAALDFGAAAKWAGPATLASVVKFLIVPAATAAFALTTGLTGPALTVALLFQTLPTASSAYILARQLGGDAPLMAGIIAVQTVLALAVLPPALMIAAALQPG